MMSLQHRLQLFSVNFTVICVKCRRMHSLLPKIEKISRRNGKAQGRGKHKESLIIQNCPIIWHLKWRQVLMGKVVTEPFPSQ